MQAIRIVPLALILSILLADYVCPVYSSMFLRSMSSTLDFRNLPCKMCPNDEECNQPPTEVCHWGESRNICGRRVCTKGPGEYCGGKFEALGICGEGLMCSMMENRCHGCFIQTLDCFPKSED